MPGIDVPLEMDLTVNVNSNIVLPWSSDGN